MADNCGTIYALIEETNLCAGRNYVKVGRSEKLTGCRMNSYGRGTLVLCQAVVPSFIQAEQALISKLKSSSSFKLVEGKETFQVSRF